jgi:hypothetical protein
MAERALPAGEPGSVGAWQQLLREWSDPALCAHRAWFDELPHPLLERALAAPHTRRILAARLHQRVPLPELVQIEDVSHMPWALGSTEQLDAVFDEAGWALLRPWVVQTIDRHEIGQVIAVVGRARYEAAFDEPLDPWRVAQRPFSFGESPQALRNTLRRLGLHAAGQLLQSSTGVLHARVRLVAGPELPLPGEQPPLAIDTEVLLALLQRQAAFTEEGAPCPA